MKIDFSKYFKTFEEKEYFTREDYAVLAMLYSYGIRQSQKENKSMLECCSFFDKGPQMSNTPEQDAELHSLRSYWLKQVTAATQFVLLSFTIDLLFEDLKVPFRTKNLEQLLNKGGFFSVFPPEQQQDLLNNYKTIKKRILDQVKNASGVNDLAILKALRDSICHNDEDGDLYNVRVRGGMDTQFALKLNKQRIELNINPHELEKLCSLYISVMDPDAGGMWVYKRDEESKKLTWGFVYGDKTLDITDRHQQAYLTRLEGLYKKFNLPMSMYHYPSKEDAGFYAMEMYNLFKSLSYYYKDCDKTFTEAFIKNTKDANILYDIESPIVRVNILLEVAILRYVLTNKTNTHYAKILEDKVNSNIERVKNTGIKNDEAQLFISKIRNSLVHGRFFIDLQNKKCVFYDMPVKGEPIKEKKMSPELADLYKPYIESGEAVDEVKNLVCIGEMSFTNLQDMISACVEYDAKRTQIKNIVERSSLIKEKPRSK